MPFWQYTFPFDLPFWQYSHKILLPFLALRQDRKSVKMALFIFPLLSRTRAHTPLQCCTLGLKYSILLRFSLSIAYFCPFLLIARLHFLKFRASLKGLFCNHENATLYDTCIKSPPIQRKQVSMRRKPKH